MVLTGIVYCGFLGVCCCVWYRNSGIWYVFIYLCGFDRYTDGMQASNFSFNGGGIYGGSNTFGLDTNTIVLFAFVLVVAIVLSYAYMWAARAFTKQFIWITGILNIIFGFATAIFMLYRKYWSGGIVFLLFAVFTLICFISWIPRIPFSVLMLQTVIDVSKKYGHVYMVSLVGGIIGTAFSAWFSVTLVAIYVKYQAGNNPACSNGNGGCSSAKVVGLVVFVTFAMYWFSGESCSHRLYSNANSC
jgi:hypothetical protein